MDRPAAAVAPVEVQVTEPDTADVVHCAQDRIRTIVLHAHVAALHAPVRITHHADPAVERPVTAQATSTAESFELASARTDREAVDLLHDRLRHRLENDQTRSVGTWKDRHGHSAPAHPQGSEHHEWRHGDAPVRFTPYFPRP
jgi:hypothetical protein